MSWKVLGRRLPEASLIVALVAIILFFGAPFLWIVAAAFDESAKGDLPWPREPTLEHFRNLFNQQDIGQAVGNSLKVAITSALLATVMAALAGFGLSRSRRRHRDLAVYLLLLLYAMPVTISMVAIYDLAGRLALVNTLLGLIIAQTAMMLPFLTWLMKSFYDAVPRSLDEAGAVDGQSPLRLWWEVLTPVAFPGVALTFGLSFLLSWSEVLLPVILISREEQTTLARAFFHTANDAGSVDSAAAIGLIYLVPVLAVFLILRRLIVRHVSGVGTGIE